jgi:predicted metal-dependent hydrolase
VPPVEADGWEVSAPYLRGVALFNAGYYWEAHEAWESLWHAAGRKGPVADVLKGLIKLAAAGVKVREGQPHGITTHARRAAELFESVHDRAGRHVLGLDLAEWAAVARRIAASPPLDPGPPDARVTRVFPDRLEPRTLKT